MRWQEKMRLRGQWMHLDGTTPRPKTTRAKTEGYARTHSSKCLPNPIMGEDRRSVQAREEANKQRRTEAKPSRENARQEGTITNQPIRRNPRG